VSGVSESWPRRIRNWATVPANGNGIHQRRPAARIEIRGTTVAQVEAPSSDHRAAKQHACCIADDTLLQQRGCAPDRLVVTWDSTRVVFIDQVHVA